jgi:hypothetical protein
MNTKTRRRADLGVPTGLPGYALDVRFLGLQDRLRPGLERAA